jgi:hypothetical protein
MTPLTGDSRHRRHRVAVGDGPLVDLVKLALGTALVVDAIEGLVR